MNFLAKWLHSLLSGFGDLENSMLTRILTISFLALSDNSFLNSQAPQDANNLE